MKQRIIFPLKFWKQGSMNWFEYEPEFRDELKEFLNNLHGLKYEESWGVVNVLNGCFTTVDRDDIEIDHCWDKVILTW